MDTINNILSTLGIENKTAIKKYSASREVSAYDLVFALINNASVSEAAKSLGRTPDGLAKWLERNNKFLGTKPKAVHWKTYLLSVINMKYCPECDTIKSYSQFYKNPNQPGGLTAVCSFCQNSLESSRQQTEVYRKNKLARSIKYRLTKQRSIPVWADLDKIKEIYKNCPKGMHVDHIVPLNGKTVSGLHVEYNLQYLSAEDNIKKSNKF